MFQIDPIVQAGNEGVVHHMILYECGDNFPQIHVDFEGKTNSPDMPPPVLQCIGLSIITAWAIGGQVGMLANVVMIPLRPFLCGLICLWKNKV